MKLDNAVAFMHEVDMHLKNRFYITAINRLYYSCLRATAALLLTKGLTSKTHRGVIKLLNPHFVSQGVFNASQASLFSKLMHERMDDDYGDSLVVDLDEIIEFIEPGKAYLEYTINKIYNP